MDINLVKSVINWVNLVKIGHFGWKWSKIRSFWPKWRHRPKFRESGKIFFSLKVLKIISVSFMEINWVKIVINGVNLVKIGHFGWKWSKIGSFWVKIAPGPKFRESCQILFSLTVFKNYFSQVYGHKFGQKCH